MRVLGLGSLLGFLLVLLVGAQPAVARGRAAKLAQESDLLEVLDTLDRQIASVALAQEKARIAFEEATESLGVAQRDVDTLQQRLAVHRDRVRRRLRARARADSGAWLRVLLDAESPGDLARRQSYARRIIAADLRLLQQLQSDEARLRPLIERRRVAAAARERSEIYLGKRRLELEGERGLKNELLREIRAERRLSRRLAAGRRRQRERLAGRLRDATPTSEFRALKGKLPKPAAGRVVRKFGKVADDASKTFTMHSGWFIDAPIGAPVRAVYDGEVVYAGWYKGFGNLVILKHDGNYYTLYAHLNSIVKAGGEAVKQGTILGEIGDTGSLIGPGLYFELRKGKRAINPRGWIR